MKDHCLCKCITCLESHMLKTLIMYGHRESDCHARAPPAKMHAPAQEAADDKVSHQGPGAASVLGCDSDTWNKRLDGPVWVSSLFSTWAPWRSKPEEEVLFVYPFSPRIQTFFGFMEQENRRKNKSCAEVHCLGAKSLSLSFPILEAFCWLLSSGGKMQREPLA